ncbi:hypothetical protein DL93DRAFT_2172633 [Clavulina sp. PMI_390]|nr:hypothetical protein DL93DRAFT_2172633 [Clavulina sp. PMI_390]
MNRLRGVFQREQSTAPSTSSPNKKKRLDLSIEDPSSSSSYTLTLSSNSYRNLVIYAPDGHPLYHIEAQQVGPRNVRGSERILVWQQDDLEGMAIYPMAVLDFDDPDAGGWDMLSYDGVREKVDWYLPKRWDGMRTITTPSSNWTWSRCFGGGLKLQRVARNEDSPIPSPPSSPSYGKTSRPSTPSPPLPPLPPYRPTISNLASQGRPTTVAKYHRRAISSSLRMRRPTLEVIDPDPSGTGSGGGGANSIDEMDEVMRFLDWIVISWIVVSRDMENAQASGRFGA